MARGSSAASTAANTGNAFADTYGGNAQSIFGPLSSELQSEAANPQGMGAPALAAATTNAEQRAGGTQGAAVGSGLLKAARTRNAGGADAAIGASARSAGQQLSNEGLDVTLANERLKQSQRQAGLGGLNSLFGENANAGNQALGEVAGNVNANTQAQNASWDWAKDLFDPILQAAGSGASAFAKG